MNYLELICNIDNFAVGKWFREVYAFRMKRAAEFVASKGADGNAIGGLAVGEPVDKSLYPEFIMVGS